MSRVTDYIIAGMLICLTAVVAAMYSAVDPAGSVVRYDRLAMGLLVALAAAALPLMAARSADRSTSRVALLVCAWLSAGLLPLAVDGILYINRADLSLAITVLVVFMLSRPGSHGLGAALLTSALIGSACYLNLTALILPLALLCTVLPAGRTTQANPEGCCRIHGSWSMLIPLAGGAGVLIAWMHQAPLLAHDYWRGLHAVQRLHDIRVLLPLLLLGFLGWQAQQGIRAGASFSRMLHMWAALALAAAVCMAAGVPLDARAAIIPPVVFAPAGLDALTQLVRSPHAVVKCVGICCSGLLALLTWPGLARWTDGLLKLVYIVSP